MKVIVIASGKGGTGKTSLAAGVAVGLAELQKKVLIIDGDCGLRNLDIVLGMSDCVVFSFADVASGVISLKKACVAHPNYRNLFLLTAPMELPNLSPDSMYDVYMQAEAEGFDYCLIDGPAGLVPELRLFSVIATQGIVVTTPESVCMRGAERAARLLEEEHLMRIRLVVNRVRPNLIRYGLASNIDDIIDTTGLQLLGMVPEDEDVIACSNSGKSILACNRGGAAKAYRNIARRLEGERLAIMRF